MLRHAALMAVLACALAFARAGAAEPPPGVCEDQLRALRVYADRLGKEKFAGDLDAAQTISGLIKQMDAMQAELEKWKSRPRPVEPPQERSP